MSSTPSTTRLPRTGRPALLCVAPPSPVSAVPPWAGALLGYLTAHGCDDFDFLDLRLFMPWGLQPTHTDRGPFGESFTIDVPDLPLLLQLLRRFDDGEPLRLERDPLFVRYCVERAINPHMLHGSLVELDRFYAALAVQLEGLTFIGFSTWFINSLSTFMLAAHLKRLQHPPFIAFGGPQTTQSANTARLALRSGLADTIVLGEGEETLLALWRAVQSGQVPIDLPGTMQREREGFRKTERQLLKLATLPVPNYDKLHLPAYPAFNGRRVLSYQLSRGCTDECSFCSEWGFWQRFRMTPVDTALDQLEELQRRYDMQGVWFTDSLLNGNMRRLREFAEGLIARKLDLVWFGYMRAQMDPDTAQLLRRAGLVRVFVGVESLSDDTLSAMNKRMTEGQNIDSLRAFLAAGISVDAGLIPGFPGDTPRRFVDTVVRLRELSNEYGGHLHLTVESAFVAGPGQPIYADLAQHGLTAQPFADDYLDVAPRYRDFTSTVMCSVEGSNQGAERLGEFLLMRGLDDWSQDQTRHPLHYIADDTESAHEPRFDHLQRDWFLLRLRTPSAMRYGLLVTGAEREAIRRMRASEGFFKGDFTTALLDKDPYAGYLRSLEAKHVVRPLRSDAPVDAFLPPPNPTGVVRSPFTIARLGDAGSGSELLVVHLVRRDLLRLPASAAGWLASLPTRFGEPAAQGTAPSDAEQAQLLDRGLVIAPQTRPVVTAVAPLATEVVPEEIGAAGLVTLGRQRL